MKELIFVFELFWPYSLLPIFFWVLFIVEMIFIVRNGRKNAVLNSIKRSNSNVIAFDKQYRATLYGKPIEVALSNDEIHFISDNKYSSVPIENFFLINCNNGKFVFELETIFDGMTVFAIKCDDPDFLEQLEAKKEISYKHSLILTRASKKAVKILSILLAVCILIGWIIIGSSTSDGCSSSSSSCGHPSCKENGPFPCYGKGNTCPNYTYCYKDLYCNQCD